MNENNKKCINIILIFIKIQIFYLKLRGLGSNLEQNL